MITAGGARSSWRGHLPALVIGALIASLALLPDAGRAALALTREGLQHGQWWRLWTAHWVHLGDYHTLLNLLGLAILQWLCPSPVAWREWWRRLLVISPAVGLGVYLTAPDIRSYVGFSGVLHGLFLLGLWPQARSGDRIAIACLAYLAGKLAWEAVMGVPLSDQTAIGGRVVTQAHLFGTLAALAYGLVTTLFTTRGERSP